jgi:hypothetical protein
MNDLQVSFATACLLAYIVTYATFCSPSTGSPEGRKALFNHAIKCVRARGLEPSTEEIAQVFKHAINSLQGSVEGSKDDSTLLRAQVASKCRQLRWLEEAIGVIGA